MGGGGGRCTVAQITSRTIYLTLIVAVGGGCIAVYLRSCSRQGVM